MIYQNEIESTMNHLYSNMRPQHGVLNQQLEQGQIETWEWESSRPEGFSLFDFDFDNFNPKPVCNFVYNGLVHHYI